MQRAAIKQTLVATFLHKIQIFLQFCLEFGEILYIIITKTIEDRNGF